MFGKRSAEYSKSDAQRNRFLKEFLLAVRPGGQALTRALFCRKSKGIRARGTLALPGRTAAQGREQLRRGLGHARLVLGPVEHLKPLDFVRPRSLAAAHSASVADGDF